jgi:hypothetical protein
LKPSSQNLGRLPFVSILKQRTQIRLGTDSIPVRTQRFHRRAPEQMECSLRTANPFLGRTQLAKDEVDDHGRREADLGFGIGNPHAEFLFERHHQFNTVESHNAVLLF